MNQKKKKKKLKEFKIQKEKLAQQRIETSAGIEKKKEAILKKFDNLMKQNKEIDPQTIKEVFPDDEELYKKVQELKKKQKEEEEKIKKKLEEQINNNTYIKGEKCFTEIFYGQNPLSQKDELENHNINFLFPYCNRNMNNSFIHNNNYSNLNQNNFGVTFQPCYSSSIIHKAKDAPKSYI